MCLDITYLSICNKPLRVLVPTHPQPTVDFAFPGSWVPGVGPGFWEPEPDTPSIDFHDTIKECKVKQVEFDYYNFAWETCGVFWSMIQILY